MSDGLNITTTPNAHVNKIGKKHWRLKLPAGESGGYRLAQLDDYRGLPRHSFPQQPPLRLELEARASQENLPGTWGFGFWNDPFSLSLGLGGGVRSLPALPNTGWFFFASPQNYLSLRNDLPAVGSLTSVLRTPNLPSLLLTPAVLALPLLILPAAVRLFRKLGRVIVKEDAGQPKLSPVEWRRYSIDWQANSVHFRIDDEYSFKTNISPRAPLGLVIWIDNQYMAIPPNGKLKYGSLANQECWIEVRNISIKQL